MKQAYIDIGELGYSFFLSAHLRWLMNRGKPVSLVMTYPGRECLYGAWVEKVISVPPEFYRDFDTGKQQEFKIGNGTSDKLDTFFRCYFNLRLPKGYQVSKDMNFDAGRIPDIYANERIFAPYPYKKKLEGGREILVFTRYRNYELFNRRDIPKKYWIKVINTLCDVFPDCTIRAVGTLKGAHNITEVRKDNYINFVGKTSDFQDVIDRCQLAIGVIGGDTGPLKFTLLQGIPTFMIGWQWDWMKEQNYLGTEFHFYKIALVEHREFDDERAITEATLFFKRYQ